MIEWIRRKLSSWWLGFKMAHGWAPRGRTDGWVRPSATLTALHLRPTKDTLERYYRLLEKEGQEVATRYLTEEGQYEEVEKRIAHGCITTVFVNDIVDSLVAAAYLNDYKYHDSGTGTGAEAAGNTGLGTPTGIARATGTQLEGASANIYRSVGTITYNGAYAITEHGLFDAATAGILMDRTVFSAINVANGDKIEFTYECTFPSGG